MARTPFCENGLWEDQATVALASTGELGGAINLTPNPS
jgi:hypothetical protein